MNTVLLRAATRSPDGTRTWAIPGHPLGPAQLVPAVSSIFGAPAFHWPHGATLRGVRLDWHRSIAKAAARELIAAYEAKP